ncbi:MAG: glycosyltransferase [Elusimicrobiota bacterium]
MKVALVHDWLTGMRGGEKVLEALGEVFPDSDIFTLVHIPGSVSTAIESHKIITSPLQNVPGVESRYRHFLPFMPWAAERFDLAGYDLIVSSSHCVAKGVRVPAGVPHVCYCHTPMRYVWDQYPDYFGAGRASWAVRAAMSVLAPRLRKWDVRTSSGVSRFIANSENVRDRIRRFYGREAEVIYPPVDVDRFAPDEKAPGDYYLMVTAFAPYKRVDTAIEAFRSLDRRLVIVGGGQEEKRLKALAGPRVEFAGWVPSSRLADYYAGCRALIFPGEEDFGIVPVEAMAAGRPVVAYGRGGALETVVEGETGVFFDSQTPESLRDAVLRCEAGQFDPSRIRRSALRFSRRNFISHFSAFLERLARNGEIKERK